MDKTNLGDRMKEYEKLNSQKLMTRLPVIARLDGRSFSNFTKGMTRPYDDDMSQMMQETTKYLVEQTNANCGYTQSDEITLGWFIGCKEKESQMLFDGKIDKLNSILASMASVKFNYLIHVKTHNLNFDIKLLEEETLEELTATYEEYANMTKQYELWKKKQYMLPTFDCRIWNVPSCSEGTNAFLWREMDATKNSISMVAQHYFSHKELQNKHQADMQDMLHEKGINWNDYPTFFKRGTYFKRVLIERKFTTEELKKLPPKHKAHSNPDLLITRSKVGSMDWKPLSKYDNTERIKLIFDV